MFLPADLDFNDEQGFQQTIVQNLGIGAKNGGLKPNMGICRMGYGIGRYNQHQPAISNSFVQNQVLKLWVKSWEALMAGDFQDLNRSEIMHNCGTTHFDLGPKNGRPWVYLKIQWKPTKFWCWITVFLIRVNIFMGIPLFQTQPQAMKIGWEIHSSHSSSRRALPWRGWNSQVMRDPQSSPLFQYQSVHDDWMVGVPPVIRKPPYDVRQCKTWRNEFFSTDQKLWLFRPGEGKGPLVLPQARC